MNMSKIVIPLSAFILVGVGANYYLSNGLEEKIKLSMEQHNKDAVIKFGGEPIINVIMGTFELKDFSIKSGEVYQVENSDLKFSGINYYNYYKGSNIINDKIKVEFNNIYTTDKIYTNHIFEIESKDSNLSVFSESKSYDATDGSKAMNQKFTLELKDIGDSYSFLTNEISKNIINKESINQSAIESKLAEISKTVVVDSLSYKIVNNSLMQDLIYENATKEYPNIKNREDMKVILSSEIDKQYQYISPEYKTFIKDLLVSENGSLTASIKNKTGIKTKDIAMQAIMSRDIENKVKEHYTIEVTK